MQAITLNVYENLGIAASTPTAATSLSSTDRHLNMSRQETPSEQSEGVQIRSNVCSPKAGSPNASVQKASSPKPSTPKASKPEASSSKPSSPPIRRDSCAKGTEHKSANKVRRWSIFNRSIDKQKDTGAKPSGGEPKGTGSKPKGNK